MIQAGCARQGARLRLWRAGCAFLAIAACAPGVGIAPPVAAQVDVPDALPAASQWPAGDGMFHRDPRWLGGDGALSIQLGAERTLWLFGDSFIDHGARSRSDALMVRNSIAIQDGPDPRTARMSFYWGNMDGAAPGSFFPEPGEHWYWPGHGVRLEEGPLLVFLYTMAATPGKDLGFASVGYALAVIDDPEAPPALWQPRIYPAPAPGFDAIPATAVLQDGAFVVAVAIRQAGVHAGALVRFPASELAAGRLGGAQWWAGAARGWLSEIEIGSAAPEFVLDDAGAECSLHHDRDSNQFVHVASYGFGATTIGVRRAPALTGPWTAPAMVYRPPESEDARPFVYAAKAHPHLRGAETGALLITYASNSFEFSDLLTTQGERRLYWPRFVSLRLP